jgi:hypothetical protein
MEHSQKIFNSEVKREKLSTENNAKPTPDEPVLYRVFANYLAKTRKSVPPKKEEKNIEKLSQMPVQMKEDES